MLCVSSSPRGVFHALQRVRASSPPLLLCKHCSGRALCLRQCGPGHPSACRGEGPGAWPAVLMALTGLARASLAHLQPRLREGQSLPGVRPQSSSHHAETCMPPPHRAAHRMQPTSLQGACPHEKRQSTQTGFASPPACCPGPRSPLNTVPGQLLLPTRCRREAAPQGPSPLGHCHGRLAPHSLSVPAAAKQQGFVSSFSLPATIYLSSIAHGKEWQFRTL